MYVCVYPNQKCNVLQLCGRMKQTLLQEFSQNNFQTLLSCSILCILRKIGHILPYELRNVNETSLLQGETICA